MHIKIFVYHCMVQNEIVVSCCELPLEFSFISRTIQHPPPTTVTTQGYRSCAMDHTLVFHSKQESFSCNSEFLLFQSDVSICSVHLESRVGWWQTIFKHKSLESNGQPRTTQTVLAIMYAHKSWMPRDDVVSWSTMIKTTYHDHDQDRRESMNGRDLQYMSMNRGEMLTTWDTSHKPNHRSSVIHSFTPFS